MVHIVYSSVGVRLYIAVYIYRGGIPIYIYTVETIAQEVVKSKTELKKTSSVATEVLVGGGGRGAKEECIIIIIVIVQVDSIVIPSGVCPANLTRGLQKCSL